MYDLQGNIEAGMRVGGVQMLEFVISKETADNQVSTASAVVTEQIPLLPQPHFASFFSRFITLQETASVSQLGFHPLPASFASLAGESQAPGLTFPPRNMQWGKGKGGIINKANKGSEV